MSEVRQTTEFRDWLNGLKNIRAAEIIAIRIARVQSGLLGDANSSTGSASFALTTAPATACIS